MDIPGQLDALPVFLLVIGCFAFLTALARGAISAKLQTASWIAFTLLFLFICRALVHAAPFAI
jgi:hypothetical protein